MKRRRNLGCPRATRVSQLDARWVRVTAGLLLPPPAPDAWKTQPPWEQAAPKDSIPKGAWWQIFNDPALDAYEQQLLQANQSLVAARDRLDQARSLARVATAGMFPQLSADPSALRERGSGQSSAEWRSSDHRELACRSPSLPTRKTSIRFRSR